MVVAWVAGIATIVAVAVLGPQAPVRPRIAVPASPPPMEQRVVAERSLWVDRPARRDEVVATREVIIKGRLSTRVDALWILIESSNGKLVATRSFDAALIGRNGTVPFESRIPLSMPRPAGSLVLMVVAVDIDGVPIEAIRRRFQLGAVVETLTGPRR